MRRVNMRVFEGLLAVVVCITLFASTAAAFSMPFNMPALGQHTTTPSLKGIGSGFSASPLSRNSLMTSPGGKTTGLTLPGMGAPVKQNGISQMSNRTSAVVPGFKRSMTDAFDNPFNSLSGRSLGPSSLFAGFPMLKSKLGATGLPKAK